MKIRKRKKKKLEKK